MKLGWKLSLPQIVIVLALGVASYTVISSSFERMQEKFVSSMVTDVFHAVDSGIDTAGTSALALAAAFSRQPEVIAAFQLAHSGNINDENSPQGQAARDMLRKSMAPALAGYENSTGRKMQLHYHLPNGRSLVRLWRKKQVQRNGVWTDVSDDISSFRNTVLDVNRTGNPVQGIELGRGGFVVRGVAPVKGPDGKALGSVETLVPFDPILEASSGHGTSLSLFMNKDQLSVARSLNDPQKYPLTGDSFVLVSGHDNAALLEDVDTQLLEEGKTGLAVRRHGTQALATHPVRDYRGQQVGVLVCALDLSEFVAIKAYSSNMLAAALAVILVLPAVASFILLRRFIIRPVSLMVDKIKDIAEDRANFDDRLHDSQKDEIGDLARWFNTLMNKLGLMMTDMQRYVDVLNTVPDPIFAVDEEYNIIMANKATQDFLGLDTNKLKDCNCHDQFSTEVCQTERCPIEMAKKVNGPVKADIMSIDRDGQTLYVKPSADVLRDAQGRKMGYVEVASNVTDLVHSQNAIEEQLARISKVNEATREAASQVTDTTHQLSGEFEQINSGILTQQQRVTETATAMEQMNATVMEVARNASAAAQQTADTRDQALEGARIVGESVNAILRVQQQTAALKEVMQNLGSRAEGIGQVMTVIRDIADQTNLLALNAAIEAARAGDAGRGFAVVADEVRKLAEKTMSATHEVGDAISAIQDGAQESIRNVDTTTEMVGNASQLAEQSGAALNKIVELVNLSSSQVDAIATAAEEQSAASEQIRSAMDEVNHIANEVAERMGESSNSVHSLSELASQLDMLSKS
ncbi:methyl-accepting chemotaxis protein [Oleidesulfovibrio alaskensis]|jgi:PAS domain S-box-containing protein|uniref:methyl-accepting chemotaxis protein n=1 Tax=Oleidesulfovibrio alaskensis TaxID=58180 RepID=UPI000406CC7D|nr:methyl-accepting chemotaxis protein [Oleidesulfovibrio alaskensis]